jgi:hypothetical protein
MKRQPRRNQSAAFKAKVAVAAVKGGRRLASGESASTSIPTGASARTSSTGFIQSSRVVFRKSLDIVCPPATSRPERA